TVRDAHGLAMSSRNAYLGDAELDIARQLNAILRRTAAALSAGADEADAIEDATKAVISVGFRKVDYVAARASVTLEPWQQNRNGRLL
ncbi:MAG: 4-phosphopantoate--beta-alanine ligase, partial [Mesorhizobium sp.]